MKLKEYLDPDNGYALFKQAGNMPLAPHCIEVPDGAEHFIRMRTGLKVGKEFFYKYIDGVFMVYLYSNWNEAGHDCAQEYVDEDDELLWSREKAQEQGLISGSDALRALADGKEVEFSLDEGIWENPKDLQIDYFLNDVAEFRLKPRTIKLELEIPAPFEPKLGETYYFITTSNSQGFDFAEFDDSDGDKLYMQLGAYRSASDVSKAFEALRGGIKA